MYICVGKMIGAADYHRLFLQYPFNTFNLNAKQKEKEMNDMGYFGCLLLAGVCALTAVFAASALVRARGRHGSAIALAVSSAAGFISTLPFGRTMEMPWLPVVASAYFGTIVLAVILCCLCQIREQTRSKKTE